MDLGQIMSHDTAKNVKLYKKNLQKYLYKPSNFTVYVQSKQHLLDALLSQNFLSMTVLPTLLKTNGNNTVFTYIANVTN